MIWFTSDTHFFHKNILHIGKGRPFGSMDEMVNTFIKKWNAKVQPNDTVWVLGDFAWGLDVKRTRELMSKLNGIKSLVLGNHDRLKVQFDSNVWAEIVPYKDLQIDNDFIVLSHYPIAEWNGYYRDTYHLYGHCHGTFNLAEETMKRKRPNGNCWDVGVDNNNYEPISLEEIKEKIKVNVEQIIKGENNV